MNKNNNDFSDEDLNALEVNIEKLMNLMKKQPKNSELPIEYQGVKMPLKEGQKYKTVAEPRKAFGKLPSHLQRGGKTKRRQRKMKKTRKLINFRR